MAYNGGFYANNGMAGDQADGDSETGVKIVVREVG